MLGLFFCFFLFNFALKLNKMTEEKSTTETAEEIQQAYEDGKTVLAREISEKIALIRCSKDTETIEIQEILNLIKPFSERECRPNSPFC